MIDWTTIKNEYMNLLQDDFLPYWKQYDDTEHGGVLNCISNDGTKLISEDKFSWSQGRYVWMLAETLELAEQGLLPRVNPEEVREALERSRAFARQCISDDHRVYYLLDRAGNPKPEPGTGELHASIFSDTFIIIGLANAMRVTGSTEDLEALTKLYASVVDRIRSNSFLTVPYAIPEGYESHSIPMILLNTSVEYARALENAAPEQTDAIRLADETAATCAKKIENTFLNKEMGLLREYVSTAENYEERLQDRHVNPGHAIEDVWFLLDQAERADTQSVMLAWTKDVARTSWKLGWDSEHGGLLRYVDKDGGKPQGTTSGSQFEDLISDTWDTKLWWPHSEALYTFLRLYSLTGEAEDAEIYLRSHEYIFRTFPDPVHGEWIQIRDRQGNPQEKVVALPVKDPFHVVRNFALIINLAASMES